MSLPQPRCPWRKSPGCGFLVHALLTVIILGPAAVPRLMKSSKPLHQWLRSGLMLSATLCNFAAVTYLRLDQTATIFFLTPLVVAALAGPLLNEWVGWPAVSCHSDRFLRHPDRHAARLRAGSTGRVLVSLQRHVEPRLLQHFNTLPRSARRCFSDPVLHSA